MFSNKLSSSLFVVVRAVIPTGRETVTHNRRGYHADIILILKYWSESTFQPYPLWKGNIANFSSASEGLIKDRRSVGCTNSTDSTQAANSVFKRGWFMSTKKSKWPKIQM